MIDTPQIAAATDAAQPTLDGTARSGAAADSAAKTAPDRPSVSAQGSARVYVDQDGSGVFIYRLVDVATGRVLVELPRERAEELKHAPGYAAGALLSTSI